MNTPLGRLVVPAFLLFVGFTALAQEDDGDEAPPAATEEAPSSISSEGRAQGGAGLGSTGPAKKTTNGTATRGGSSGGSGGGEASSSGEGGAKITPKGSGQVSQIGGHRVITAYEGQFVAIPFHTRAAKAMISIPWSQIGGRATWADATWNASISAKAGDFSAPAGCNTSGGADGMVNAVVSVPASKNACQLQPNKTYYFNMYCAKANPKSEPCYTSADIWYNEFRPDGSTSQIPSEWAKP